MGLKGRSFRCKVNFLLKISQFTRKKNGVAFYLLIMFKF